MSFTHGSKKRREDKEDILTTAQIQKRNGKAKAQNLKVIKVEDEQFCVESSEGKIFYKVNIDPYGQSVCSCGDYVRNIKTDPNFRCKHILAVMDCDGVFEQTDALERKVPRLDQRFIKSISGRDFCLYSGLLDYAHQKGLLKLECEILQYPKSDNGYEAICKAVAETKTGEVFVDIGDANSKNTNKMIAPHIIRMASTRAKARCLRDLCNIGMTCLEELGDLNEVIGMDNSEAAGKPKKIVTRKSAPEPERPAAEKEEIKTKSADPAFSETPGEGHKEPATPVHEKPQKTEATRAKGKGNGTSGNDTPKISEAQRRATINLARRRGISIEELEGMVQQAYGVSVDELTQAQASAFIRNLQSAA